MFCKRSILNKPFVKNAKIFLFKKYEVSFAKRQRTEDEITAIRKWKTPLRQMARETFQ